LKVTPLVNNVIFNDLKQIKKMDELIKKIRAVVPTTEQAKDRTPEYAFGWIDSLNAITEVVKNNVVLQNVSSCFAVIDEEDNVVQLYQTEEKANNGLNEFRNNHPHTTFYVDTLQIN